MPPASSVSSTYFACPTAHFERSRQVRYWVKRAASGPAISTCRSTATSQTVTSLTSFQKSATGLS